jgi:NitT/TauT family transport system substrate-binding protein
MPAALLLRALAGLLALAGPLAAGATTRVRLITDWYPQPEHGGFYHAQLHGFYRDAGLEVEIVPGGPNTFAVQRVATRQGDFGMGSSDDVLLANERGIPLVAVGATMQHDPQGILLHAGSPVRDFPDLEGRAIAVTPGASWFRYLVKRYGLQRTREIPHTYSISAFVKDTNHIQQCFLTSEPFFARQAGVETRVLLIKDTGYDPYRVFFTRRELVERSPALVAAFADASVRGWRDYLANPGPVHAELRRLNPELSPEKMGFSVAALKEHRFVEGAARTGPAFGELRPERWQAQHGLLRDLGLIRGPFAVTNVFLPRAALPAAQP